MQFGISCCWQEIHSQYLDKIEGFFFFPNVEQAVPCKNKQTDQLLTTVWKWLFLWQVWHEDMRSDSHRARVSSPANGQGHFSSAAFAQMLLQLYISCRWLFHLCSGVCVRSLNERCSFFLFLFSLLCFLLLYVYETKWKVKLSWLHTGRAHVEIISFIHTTLPSMIYNLKRQLRLFKTLQVSLA